MATTQKRGLSRFVRGKFGRNRVVDIICPDGIRRNFSIQGKTDDNNPRGYVQVKGVSVSGYAKRQGNGWKFYPHYHGKHIGLVRPATLKVNTKVRITDQDHPNVGKTGRVSNVGWNYLTPTYSVRLDDRRFKSPVSVVGTDSIVGI